MCGRLTQAYTWQENRDLYDLTEGFIDVVAQMDAGMAI